MKSTKELEQAAKHFIQKYKDKSNEKSDAQSFWIDFLGIFVDEPTQKINFEKTVPLGHTSFIDAYIPHAKTVIIPRGKLYKITLSDGSEVWLNADSRLTFPSHFVGDKRMVSLEGEAYFKVAKDPRHPFIVKCGEIETMVLGTEFNIRSYNNQPEVALISGSVAVKDSRDHTFTLTPGQAVTLFDEGFQAREIDTEYYKKWREGMFYFEEASLLEVMCEIGRWYNVNINIVDPELNDYKLHFAADREESISQIIQYLACLSYLDISKKGNLITIRKKNI